MLVGRIGLSKIPRRHLGTGRGRQPVYSALAIATALTLQAVFRLALRQTEGSISSIWQLLVLHLAVPDYSNPEPPGRDARGGAAVIGGGAYHRDDVSAATAARYSDAAVVVPPRARAVPSAAFETEPTQRDAHLRSIAERGRMGWQRAPGYNWRALVEADVSRRKRVIGDELRPQTDGRQAKEMAIAASVLNPMLELGWPEYVRTA